MTRTFNLLYHALDSPSEPVIVDDSAALSVVVNVDSFQRQLQSIRQFGKQIVSLEEVLSSGSAGPKQDRIVLTFDDGHKSNWSLALPALLEAGATATFYVIAGLVDNDPEYLTSAQLREMAAHNMLIGSHTVTHRWLPELRPEEIRNELVDSKAQLEDILHQPVLDFALPGGHSNRLITDVARECGYRSIATCKIGTFRPGDDPFHLPRLEIRRGLSMAGFRNTFRGSKVLQLQILEAAKTCLRNSCGLARYTRLRRLAHQFVTLNR